MKLLDTPYQDVMQVCRNGHVITDLLRTYPERAMSHCDRCGAVTVVRCLTCGLEIPGSIHLPETPPMGSRQAPPYCAGCGAAFPWTQKSANARALGPLPILEKLLRRLPQVARQLRVRHANRPPFRVEDDHDLSDLLRALLPIHFDEVRTEQRTPRYATATRTDFLLGLTGVALVGKRVSTARRGSELTEELREDVKYYEGRTACKSLVIAAYDPEALLHDPRRLEGAWADLADVLRIRAVIVS
jgi:hypothetical protein